MSSLENKQAKGSLLGLILAALGALLIVYGAARLVSGLWTAEAAQSAGATNALVSGASIVVGVALVVAWGLLKRRG